MHIPIDTQIEGNGCRCAEVFLCKTFYLDLDTLKVNCSPPGDSKLYSSIIQYYVFGLQILYEDQSRYWNIYCVILRTFETSKNTLRRIVAYQRHVATWPSDFLDELHIVQRSSFVV
jgi:hypothetical protein